MWECKLAIIQCSGHLDNELIQNIWQHIILTNLKLAKGSPDDKFIILLNKIKVLWNEYKDSDMCFPLGKFNKHLVIAENNKIEGFITFFD